MSNCGYKIVSQYSIVFLIIDFNCMSTRLELFYAWLYLSSQEKNTSGGEIQVLEIWGGQSTNYS